MTFESLPNTEVPKPIEIERKFYVNPEALSQMVEQGFHLESYPHKKIDQGYLTNSPDGAVRVRRKGDKHFLTFKSEPQHGGVQRVELETELTAEQFETMWPGTEGRRVEKTRYEIPGANGDYTIELDVFEGDNAGHILAEVEFFSLADAQAFEPPEWFGLDVTADKDYGNAKIAEQGFPPSPYKY